MVKGFYQMIARWGLVTVLFVLIVINMWQNDRMEAKQIKILAELKNMKRKMGSGGMGGPVMPSTSARFSNDAGNMLQEDKDAWLPDDAQQGGTLKMKFRSDPKGLNFLTENGTDVSTIQNYTSMGLIQRHKNDIKKYGPELATFYGRSDDYKTYTYKLRNDVFWHEPAVENTNGEFDWLINGNSCREGHFINGRCRVTAHDVVFMLDMMQNPQVAGAAPLRAYFKDLESYKATSDFELTLKFKSKTYKNDLVSKWIYPIGEFLYGYDEEGEHFDEADIGSKFQEHWYNPKALGCGAYRFVEFKSGEYIKLERDPLYPLGGNSFNEILIQIVKNENQPARMLQNGDLHISTLSTPQYRKNLLEAKDDSPFKDGTINNDTFWSYGYTYIGWNADLPLFEDKRVRQAMSHSFNADLVLDEVYLNLGERTTGPLSTFLPHYDKDLQPLAFDLEKAKALLDEAGWIDTNGDGTRDKMVNGSRMDFAFEYTFVSGSSTNQTIGNIFKEDLNKIGIDMTLRPLEWASLLKKINAKEFQAIVLGWGSSPDVDFHQIWHSSQADVPKGSNRVGFRNKEADAIIEEMEMEFDMEKRIELAKKFHRLLYDEQPYTFLFTYKNPYFYRAELKNAKTSLVRPYFNPRPWYLSAP